MYKITSKTTKKGQNEHSLEHWDQRSAIIKAPQISMLIRITFLETGTSEALSFLKHLKIKENHQKSSQITRKTTKHTKQTKRIQNPYEIP